MFVPPFQDDNLNILQIFIFSSKFASVFQSAFVQPLVAELTGIVRDQSMQQATRIALNACIGGLRHPGTQVPFASNARRTWYF